MVLIDDYTNPYRSHLNIKGYGEKFKCITRVRFATTVFKAFWWKSIRFSYNLNAPLRKLPTFFLRFSHHETKLNILFLIVRAKNLQNEGFMTVVGLCRIISWKLWKWLVTSCSTTNIHVRCVVLTLFTIDINGMFMFSFKVYNFMNTKSRKPTEPTEPKFAIQLVSSVSWIKPALFSRMNK